MKKPVVAFAVASVSALVLAGCSASAAPVSGGDDLIQVVASTNVYGSLAEQIGGDRVEVTSIITSASQDPHSYEASARDRLTVQDAELVIENGGGYDSFIDSLIGESDAHVFTAATFSHDYPGDDGHDETEGEEHADDEHDDHADDDHAEEEHAEGEDHDHDEEGDDHADEDGHVDEDEDHADEDHADEDGHDDHDHADEDGHEGHDHIAGFNEHVWFDPHTMIHVVEGIAEEFSELDPDGEGDFTAAAAEIVADLEGFEADLENLGTEAGGASVFITEPLPGYIAAAAGLTDVTPEGFAEAVEEGTDVAPATLLAALDVIDGGDVNALLTNAQTGGAETERVEEAAEAAGIPVVAFTELLEEGSSYSEWMREAIQDLAAALQQ